jgi:uncharacterized membrane protein YbhN (UPF0104 family)
MSPIHALRQRAAAIPPAWRRRLFSGLGLALSLAALGILAWLVYRERATLLPHLRTVHPARLAPVVALYALDLAVVALAWASIANALGIRVSLARHLRIFAASNAARRLPGTIWYVGGRGALYGRVGVSPRPILVGSAVELALLWVSALAIAAAGVLALLPQQRWLYAGLAVVVLLALLNPVTLDWAIRRTTRGQGDITLLRRQVYGWLVAYLLAWVLGGLVLFAIIAMFQPIGLTAVPLVVAAWTVSATLSMLTFFLPSGFGVMELSLTALLAPIVSPGLAVVAALAMRVLVTALDVLFGLTAYALEVAQKP